MKESIDDKFLDSFRLENLSQIAEDLSEVALDSILEEGPLREIPIINSINAIWRTGYEIRHQMYIKKIVKFFEGLATTPLKDRVRFLEIINKNPNKKHEFSETILLLIERADHFEKPLIIGRIMKNHILGKISYEEAIRLAFIVDKVYLTDLSYLIRFQPGVQKEPDIAASLQSVGLLRFDGLDGGNVSEDSGGVIYGQSKYGQMLIKFGLETME